MPETPQTCAILVLMRLDFLSPGFAISIMSISLVTELFGSKGEAAVTWLALGPALGLVAMFLRGSTKLRWPKSSRYE